MTREIRFFVGGPFSSAMYKSPDGLQFDSSLRETILGVLSTLTERGHLFFSSHIADHFGTDFDESAIVQRDNNWVRECDIYLALLPFTELGVPPRTDGTWVEVGLALALGKRVVLAIQDPDHPSQSFYVRNLHQLDQVRFIEWNRFKQSVGLVVDEEATLLRDRRLALRVQATDADSGVQRLAANDSIHSVDVCGLHLTVLPGVFSPKYSHAPDFVMDNWLIPTGSRVLDLGCGSGVLGLGALRAGAGTLVAVDANSIACENTILNAKALGYVDRVEVLEGNGYAALSETHSFDVVLLRFRCSNHKAATPLESACFDDGYSFLKAALIGARSRLVKGGHVFVVFSDQGDLAELINTVHAADLTVTRLLLQRPTMVGGHIRVFLDLI